jgi:hypothetical protein
MELHECPYCNMPGLVTQVRTSAGGFEVRGKCVTCGYSYASEYGPDEAADDLPEEYSLQLEPALAD